MLEIGQGKELAIGEYKSMEKIAVIMATIGLSLIFYSLFMM